MGLRELAVASLTLDPRPQAGAEPYYASEHAQSDPVFAGSDLDVVEQSKIYLKACPDGKLTKTDSVEGKDEAGNSVVVTRWKFTGTHTGTVFGVRPTGRKVEIEGMTWMQFAADSKEQAAFVQADGIGVLQEVGLFPYYKFPAKRWQRVTRRGVVIVRPPQAT